MSKPPLVSIGLPTYNGARTLRRAVESALAQDYPDLELVISDNASTDQTPSVCEEYAARDARVRYIRQERNLGAAENFRRALAASRGEFFMWLADDDWLDPDYVSRCVGYLREHPDCRLVSGRGKYYRGEEFRFDEPELNLSGESGAGRVLAYYGQAAANGIFYGLMPRGVLDELPPLHVLGGDWLFLSHVAFRGKMKTLPETFIHRSLEGISQDADSIARHYSLSEFEKRHMYLILALKVFEDIAWRSPVFGTLGRLARWLLAWRAAAVIVANYSLPRWLRLGRRWNDLRARLSLRTRLRLLMQRWLH
jgi:glycosyltransferase involved in cell wall biosynthesis